MPKGSRGEIWRANLGDPIGPEQAGTRPVLILQTADLDSLRTVVVVPLTTNPDQAAFATGIQFLAGEAGLPKTSVALCHQVMVTTRDKLADLYGVASPERLMEVEKAVAWVLGLPAL